MGLEAKMHGAAEDRDISIGPVNLIKVLSSAWLCQPSCFMRSKETALKQHRQMKVLLSFSLLSLSLSHIFSRSLPLSLSLPLLISLSLFLSLSFPLSLSLSRSLSLSLPPHQYYQPTTNMLNDTSLCLRVRVQTCVQVYILFAPAL